MAVMAVHLAEQPVRQVSLIDCWCGPTGAKRCRSHNKRRCATALKCSSSFTISSAPAEYWALQACLPRSFVGCFFFFPTVAFFPYLHIMEALFPLSTPVWERRGKKQAPERVNRTACLKTLCYLVAGKKKTKSICHQMHRVMINKVGPN